MARRLTIIEKHRRWKWPFIAFAVPMMLIASFGVAIPLWMARDHPVVLGAGIVYCVGAFVGMRLWMRRVMRMHHGRYEACDWSACLYCEYDLRGREERGRCPECGEEYDLAHVREEWKRHWKWKGT